MLSPATWRSLGGALPAWTFAIMSALALGLLREEPASTLSQYSSWYLSQCMMPAPS